VLFMMTIASHDGIPQLLSETVHKNCFNQPNDPCPMRYTLKKGICLELIFIPFPLGWRVSYPARPQTGFGLKIVNESKRDLERMAYSANRENGRFRVTRFLGQAVPNGTGHIISNIYAEAVYAVDPESDPGARVKREYIFIVKLAEPGAIRIQGLVDGCLRKGIKRASRSRRQVGKYTFLPNRTKAGGVPENVVAQLVGAGCHCKIRVRCIIHDIAGIGAIAVCEILSPIFLEIGSQPHPATSSPLKFLFAPHGDLRLGYSNFETLVKRLRCSPKKLKSVLRLGKAWHHECESER
jgi:hypothetical protein